MIQQWDEAIVAWFRMAPDWLLFQGGGYFFASVLPYLLAVGAVIAALLLPKKIRKFAVGQALLAILLARGVVATAIYMLYQRPRPFAVLDFDPMFFPFGAASFPSGHAIALAALAASFWPYYKIASRVLFLGAIINGIGRVYVGVHWPSDVLAGLTVGLAAAYLVELLVRPIRFQLQ